MPPRAPAVDLGDITTISRADFLAEYWDYAPGDHVTVLAPSGGGKTHLAYELLGVTARPELQAVVFVMKPKDETVVKFSKRYGFRTIRDWPPPTPERIRGRVFRQKIPGYVLWPRETDNPEADDRRHQAIFRRALRQLYRSARKHPNIVFADETYSLEQEMKLTRDVVRVETKGRSVGCGLWAASQRPAYINKWAYQAQHLFLGFDPDVETQKRYGDIGGGIDPATVRAATASLGRFQFVYIDRENRAMCIIDAT
jgi:hypothetical protein